MEKASEKVGTICAVVECIMHWQHNCYDSITTPPEIALSVNYLLHSTQERKRKGSESELGERMN